jgi:hypothetical protein
MDGRREWTNGMKGEGGGERTRDERGGLDV